MGMAAGQARLLSITSRLSDNELRAQIINNNKMRLATESSQASEAYIAALNKAQMMFTSYDKDNNASYQKLSFNALTAYNPYNNQYALTNTGGQVLISELDASRYEAANGNLTEFLQSYGLVNTTSYFNNLGTVPFGSQVYDEEGNPVDPPEFIGFHYYDEADGMEKVLQLDGDMLKALYEGGPVDFLDGKIGELTRLGSDEMSAYDMTASSSAMYDYEKYLFEYEDSYNTYLNMTASVMQEELLKLLCTAFGVDYEQGKTSMDSVLAKLSGNSGDFEKLYDVVSGTNFSQYLSDPTSAYLDNLKNRIYGYKFGFETSSYTINGSNLVDSNDEIVGQISGTNTFQLLLSTDPETGEPTYSNPMQISPNGGPYSTYHFDEATNTYVSGAAEDGTYVQGRIIDGKLFVEEKLPDDFNYMNAAKQLINELSAAIMNVWNADLDDWHTKTDDIQEAYYTYMDNAYELAKVIYGVDKAESMFTGEPGHRSIIDEGDNKEIVKNLADIMALYNNYGDWGEFRDDVETGYSFKQVFCNLLLDMVMDTYGEPKYTWIDTTNPNENGEAKAKWYTNLFELIEKNGYKTLLDGIASSNEWIQFAFENGMVQMKQIDEHNAWNNIIYSNCSDITEQTDDKAIAIAEAEYNAAMNRIENKDKRYDLELKNIDTEHNSLQTEYDSIKTAIDKNIERNFKLYS